MDNQDHSQRVLAFGFVIAVIVLIFAYGYARADSFNERFTTGAPKSGVLNPPARDNEETLPAEQWGIKLLLLIDGKVARAIPYNAETYPTGDACKNAVVADTRLQVSTQAAAKVAVENFGATAAVAIACAMQLD